MQTFLPVRQDDKLALVAAVLCVLMFGLAFYGIPTTHAVILCSLVFGYVLLLGKLRDKNTDYTDTDACNARRQLAMSLFRSLTKSEAFELMTQSAWTINGLNRKLALSTAYPDLRFILRHSSKLEVHFWDGKRYLGREPAGPEAQMLFRQHRGTIRLLSAVAS